MLLPLVMIARPSNLLNGADRLACALGAMRIDERSHHAGVLPEADGITPRTLASRSIWRIHTRSVSDEQAITSVMDRMAAPCVSCVCCWSITSQTARS